MAEAIILLSDHPNLVSQKGRNARVLAETHFDRELVLS